MKLDAVRFPSPSDLDGRDEFLAAVPENLRGRVRHLLCTPRFGGRGLRAWMSRLETEGPCLPSRLPEGLVEVYLEDDEAEPSHDCESCGLAVPVHCGRNVGHESTDERSYFPTCPHCGGRTGRYAYWSRTSSGS